MARTQSITPIITNPTSIAAHLNLRLRLCRHDFTRSGEFQGSMQMPKPPGRKPCQNQHQPLPASQPSWLSVMSPTGNVPALIALRTLPPYFGLTGLTARDNSKRLVRPSYLKVIRFTQHNVTSGKAFLYNAFVSKPLYYIVVHKLATTRYVILNLHHTVTLLDCFSISRAKL